MKQVINPRSIGGVSAGGRFMTGVHAPSYTVDNFRETDAQSIMGVLPDGTPLMNQPNLPDKGVAVPHADTIYEVPNAFPFRGTTYINSRWADRCREDITRIRLSPAPPVSMKETLEAWSRNYGEEKRGELKSFLATMPAPLQLALAETSTDPADLMALAELSCSFSRDDAGRPRALVFETGKTGAPVPVIHAPELFEVLANNPCLPDAYKRAMVLTPGVQGASEIVGEWREAEEPLPREAPGTHVYEYLRTNSYIPWGHYAANMAEDAVRYRIGDVTPQDMQGMRHLYYQRTYVHLARQLGISLPGLRRTLSREALETLRLEICRALSAPDVSPEFDSGLWGWNFGFGFSPSGYRLHASHQQVHQQYAMVPGQIPETGSDAQMAAYACGDLVADFIERYRQTTGRDFFDNYLHAVRHNRRVDGRDDLPEALTVFQDDHILLFVPKAQTSQWELQMMPLSDCGNVLEADQALRDSLDRGLLRAQRIFERLGARMVTSIEFSKRFGRTASGQRLLYALLPRLPHSPGAFSEAQLRWITGHYPEDFARACRSQVTS